METQYDFGAIEKRWQAFWKERKTFRAQDGLDKPTYYVLDMFPYPSGAGLHIGHPEGYTASDILARYKRAQGYNVLHPMGWDAFGLPAEQYAVKTGIHPSITTEQNICNIRKQIQALGFAIDWEREINTTDPSYYRWTQWIFLKLFKAGLAYIDERPVWWCSALGTVLANEEVINGRSERGNHPVERRKLRQWVLRITAYADKLLEGLKDLDWPDSTKRQQALWIGRSEGANIHFSIEGHSRSLDVFTTCAHTAYGITYLVVAPEHPALEDIVTPECREAVKAYQQKTASKSDLERTELSKDKTGVFTGAYATHPLTGQRLPIWVADYVLMSYASGAVMAVPAHDERDYAFALTYQLPIKRVVDVPHEETPLPYMGPGVLVNSERFDGLDIEAAKQALLEALKGTGEAEPSVQYKLRDWLFSRQRYWGEPFPILWLAQADYKRLQALPESPLVCPKDPVCYVDDSGVTRCAVGVPETALPVVLPEMESFAPSSDTTTPLSKATDWVHLSVHIQTGHIASGSKEGPLWVSAQRETNTMPQWAGSCWYHLRYLDPHNDKELVSKAQADYWGTPDFYIGGAEHAVLHLLYARFWHRFLFDQNILSDPEPYRKLFHQGIILGEDGEKMSKSRGNVVNPDAIIEEYGADALRLFEMFLGPLEAAKPWSTQGIEGPFRFLKKAHREFLPEGQRTQKIQPGAQDGLERILHESIAKVTEAIENLRLNTAISQLMVLLNHMSKASSWAPETALAFVRMLEPFAPHLAEELALHLGHTEGLSDLPWPQHDPKKLEQDNIKLIIQVNGRLRAELQVPKDLSQDAALKQATPKIHKYLNDQPIRKVIYVPNRILNIVC